MPTLSITKTYSDGNYLYETDLDNIRNDLQTFFNTTKIDASNIQDSGVTAQKIADGAITNSKLATDAVTNVKILDSTIEKTKLSLVAQSFLFKPGMIIPFHKYGSLFTSPGQGWMLCDGRQITSANYDAEHGAGSYDTYISPLINGSLVNRYLPNMADRYLVGNTSLAQDGSVAFTYEGNASHQINLAHTHTSNHVHRWYVDQGSANQATTFDAAGSGTGIVSAGSTNTHQIGSASGGNRITAASTSLYTENTAAVSDSQLSATQSVKPESFRTLYYMRIV